VLEAAGLAIFLRVMKIDSGKLGDALRRSALVLAIAGALLTLLQHVLAPARLAASFSGIVDISLQEYYLRSDAGIADAIRLSGMAAIALGITTRNRWLTLAGVLGACLSFAAMGHTASHSPRWLLASLLVLHVALIAFWFGSLRPLRRMVAADNKDATVRLEQFSGIATRFVPLIFIAGLGLAIALLDSFAALTTPYGLMIVAKVTGFTVLLGLASFNRWRLLPQIRSGQATASQAFRSIAAVEWFIIVTLIITTVSVTSLFSP
jgi:putative copper export protein